MTGESGGWGQGSWPADDPDLRPRRTGPPQPQRPSFPPPPPRQGPPLGPPGAVPQVPLHAQPTRIVPAVGLPVEPPAEPKPKRRKRRKLVWALAVVVLLALAGGALVVPDVANRLELPWAPNKPLADAPGPISVERQIHGPQGAESPSKSGVTDALRDAAGNPALGELSGTVVDPNTGDVLWERDANHPLPPASTTKLLTAAAALLTLKHDVQLSTRVVQGEQPGEVVLVGGGDPTLTGLPNGDRSLYPGGATLDDLVKQVRKTTGGDVDTVSVDTSAFAGQTRGPGWAPDDAPSTYAAPVEAAMLDGGRENPTDPDSKRTGDPAGELAAELAERLGAKVGSTEAAAPEGAKVLGKVRSAPLDELVGTMLTDSDNVLAEAIARRVAVAEGEEPSFDGASAAMRQVLEDAGFDLTGVELADASGLSTKNRIPARLLTDVLAAAAGDDGQGRKLRPLLAGLPVAGGTGTLADRYTEGPSEDAKGWVRAKTGTLSEVNTLAGVVLDRDGAVLVFALMSSGTNPDDARPALDEVAAALRDCGCR